MFHVIDFMSLIIYLELLVKMIILRTQKRRAKLWMDDLLIVNVWSNPINSGGYHQPFEYINLGPTCHRASMKRLNFSHIKATCGKLVIVVEPSFLNYITDVQS